ncbi:hypothetical protein PRK78_004600 [Emydomyces testavorans]|uniref:Threonine/serine exporter-like N-terminal domain-containing protein n=1 Tax=Emydomyces testavorans TaxID=2070801 RepID=A0AAF0DI15_9EURO|nr:hypothetical protein PRK78_004600 [Emydomyces testavorans]
MESSPSTPSSSRSPSPDAVYMAPSQSALRRGTSPRNGGQRSKALRWTSPVNITTRGDALPENLQDISQYKDNSQPQLQMPAATRQLPKWPSHHGGLLAQYDTETRPENSPMAGHSTGVVSKAIEEGLNASNSAQPKGSCLHAAYERAQSLASRIKSPSFVWSKKSSARNPSLPPQRDSAEGRGDAIITINLNEKDEEPFESPAADQEPFDTSEAHDIVRRLSRRGVEATTDNNGLHSGQVTPYNERDPNDYVEPPSQYRSGILFNLLKLYDQSQQEQREERPGSSSASPALPLTQPSSQQSSGLCTPRSKPKWHSKSRNVSSSSLTTLLHGQNPRSSGDADQLKRSKGSGMLATAAKKLRPRPRLEDEIRVTVHIAETLSRQRYLMKLCQALMRYGAPTHRLEEYMRMTARVLEIDAQFLYLPGCMFVSFGDGNTHTTDLKLLKYPQGVDLGRLVDVHEIYKEVVHDVIGVEEATQKLDEIIHRKDGYNKLWLILLYGCASATVGPFAFNAGAVDMPVAFFLGCLLGVLQYLVVPRSPLYSNVFELTAALVMSFLARALGSIRLNPGDTRRLFCFPALAQSAIALILPGYIVLCSSLELQSRNILAGSVRLVYSIIYSLVLGFGMMLGTSFYGSIDPSASAAYACSEDGARFGNWNEYARKFPFVILFTFCLIRISRAKWEQTPMMLAISCAGYVVNFFSAKHFAANTQIASALGAFAIGVMGNLYGRLRHGLAAAAILPAIFVQVPSGLAASGSLVAGLAYANELNRNSTALWEANKDSADVIFPPNITNLTGTAGSGTGGGVGELSTMTGANKLYGNVVFDLAYGMVQVSIAITVGLFLAALVVYPFGKRRSGLFSF